MAERRYTLTIRADAVAEAVLDQDGQGHVTVGACTTHAFWACGVCGIPTGGKSRLCSHHPAAPLFMKHIREEPIGVQGG